MLKRGLELEEEEEGELEEEEEEEERKEKKKSQKNNMWTGTHALFLYHHQYDQIKITSKSILVFSHIYLFQNNKTTFNFY